MKSDNKDKIVSESTYKNTALLMMRIIANALSGCEYEIPVLSEDNYRELYSVARRHSMRALTAYSLNALHIPAPDDFREAYGFSLRRTVLIDRERKKILDAFEANGIRYLPLKGIVLKKYYPALGIREMSDNDILIDASGALSVRRIMQKFGYSCSDYGKGHHDSYKKNPFYLFEMHRSLTDELDWKEYAVYYRSIFDRLQKDDDNGYGYHFSDEDFYIYHIIHAKIHFDTAGIGLRELVDLFVLQQRFGDSIDKAYIGRELAALGADSFERQLVAAMQSVFFDKQSELTENEILDYMISSGAYGTYRNLLDNTIDRSMAQHRKRGKLYYIKERFRTPESMLRDRYPFFYRHRRLEPVLWIYRPVKKLIKRPRSVIRELKTLADHSKKSIER